MSSGRDDLLPPRRSSMKASSVCQHPEAGGAVYRKWGKKTTYEG